MNTPEERCAMFCGALMRRQGNYEPPPRDWSKSARVAYAHGYQTGHVDCDCHAAPAGAPEQAYAETDNPIIDIAVSALVAFAPDGLKEREAEHLLGLWRYNHQLTPRERDQIMDRFPS